MNKNLASTFKLCLVIFFVVFFQACGELSNSPKPSSIQGKESMVKMAEYNTWANKQLVDWMAEANEDQWNREVISSFKSLNLTTRHLWNAEWGWLTTLKNESWSTAIDVEDQAEMTDVLQGFLKTTKEFETFVTQMEDNALLGVREIGANDEKISCLEIIQHVYNHATYHRGQLITLGRQVGLKNPPRTDYIYFFMINE